MHAWRAVGALAIAATLSGCVAAVVPIAAAGAIARKQPKSKKVSPTRSADPAARGKMRPGKLELLPLKELPPPDGTSVSPFDDFSRYTLAQHKLGVAGKRRDSAVMAPDSTLSVPKVVPCGTRPTAVIVDADLQDGGTPLSVALAGLRAEGIKVLWILREGEDASVAPKALAVAGFIGDDGILTSPPSGLRRQAVRQLATIEHCIVAIAGRRRGDMDELYDYLRDPNTIVPSDMLWNRGWFLIPATPDLRPAPKGTP